MGQLFNGAEELKKSRLVLSVGELEGFCKSEGNHGPRWVQRVIENYDLATDPHLAEGRTFVQLVWDRLH